MSVTRFFLSFCLWTPRRGLSVLAILAQARTACGVPYRLRLTRRIIYLKMGSSQSTQLSYVLPASDWLARESQSNLAHCMVSDFCLQFLDLATFVAKRNAWTTTEVQVMAATEFDDAMGQALADRCSMDMPYEGIRNFLMIAEPGSELHEDGVSLWQLTPTTTVTAVRITLGVCRIWATLRYNDKVAVCYLLTASLATDFKMAVAHGLIQSGMLRYDACAREFVVGLPTHPSNSGSSLVTELTELLGVKDTSAPSAAADVDDTFEVSMSRTASLGGRSDFTTSDVDVERLVLDGEII